jgi:hypothetical protein
LHLHFIVEGTEWGFLEGSLIRVGRLHAWLWMPVICNFTARKSGCFFLRLPRSPPLQWMEREQNPTVNKEFSIHLWGISLMGVSYWECHACRPHTHFSRQRWCTYLKCVPIGSHFRRQRWCTYAKCMPLCSHFSRQRWCIYISNQSACPSALISGGKRWLKETIQLMPHVCVYVCNVSNK